MKKKFTSVLIASVLTLGGCAASAASASDVMNAVPSVPVSAHNLKPTHSSFVSYLLSKQHAKTMLEKEAIRTQKLFSNRIKIRAAVKKVQKYAGKTWYVFSGATPSGWDCSGLVRWTYEQVGVELEHRANAEANSGKKVKNPLPGDVVAFYYKGSNYSFHVGIYLGNGKMIHAYRLGMRTVIQPVKQVVKENWGARVTYTRILPQPEN